jgi:ERF superfamily
MELLNRIQRELKVPKSQFNAFAKYNYRNCEDILEAVKPLLGTEGTLTLSDDVVEVGGRCYVKATATLSYKNLEATATGYAREALDKKGMDEAQITGAASSYARKYALNGLFCIDDTKDADNEDNSAKPAAKPIAPKIAEQSKAGKKAAIADLLRSTVNADPTNLFDVPATKEEYEAACLQYTGLELNDGNLDAVLKALLK